MIKATAHYKAGHRSEPHEIEVPDDVDRVIDFLLSTTVEYHSAAMFFSMNRRTLPSGFPDHQFIIGINPENQMGAITFGYEAVNVATVGQVMSDDEVLYHIAGHEAFFPENSEIPIHLIRDAVKEFVFSGGDLPICVAWQPVLI